MAALKGSVKHGAGEGAPEQSSGSVHIQDQVPAASSQKKAWRGGPICNHFRWLVRFRAGRRQVRVRGLDAWAAPGISFKIQSALSGDTGLLTQRACSSQRLIDAEYILFGGRISSTAVSDRLHHPSGHGGDPETIRICSDPPQQRRHITTSSPAVIVCWRAGRASACAHLARGLQGTIDYSQQPDTTSAAAGALSAGPLCP